MLEPFRDAHSTIPIQYIYAYFLVVLNEGKGVTEYAEAAQVTPAIMTRHLLDIGERSRDREEGLGLIEQHRDAWDLRKRRAFLTPKGKAIFHKVMRALDSAVKR
jgi:DNA-binding MarR family transcriptional regulator